MVRISLFFESTCYEGTAPKILFDQETVFMHLAILTLQGTTSTLFAIEAKPTKCNDGLALSKTTLTKVLLLPSLAFSSELVIALALPKP